MSDSLLDAAIADTDADKKPPRPEEIPEKFWDAERGEVRVDALIKSYRELERAMSRRAALPGDDAPEEERQRFRRMMGIPDSPEGYEITPKHELVGPDPEVNRVLFEAGFTPRQAQLVYDLAAERLLPLIAEAAQQFEAERQVEKLREHFGGEERFRRIAKQVNAWGREHLPAPMFEAMSTTAEGVIALAAMMEKGEPPMARSAEAEGPMDERALRKMMDDPRYWRSREPEFVKRVTEGFRRLTGG
jgi:hypothetical protein